MKLILLILLFPFVCYAQDSTRYEFKDSAWYQITVTQNSYQKEVKETYYTKYDSLMASSLSNQIYDLSKQYHAWKIQKEKEEKFYLSNIKTFENLYKQITKSKPDLDSISNAKQIIGTWMLNDKIVKITKQLKIEEQSINFLSESVFWINLNSKREYFFKKGKHWISDNYKLIQVLK